MKKLLVIVSTSPFNSVANRDALDFIMSAGGYGHWVDALFIDDGVFCLAPTAQKHDYTLKSTEKNIKSFTFFDVENTYVCAHSAKARKLEDAIKDEDFTALDASARAEFVSEYDMVVNF